jgi:hypothetical protein
MKRIWIGVLAAGLLCGASAYAKTDSETATRLVTAAYQDVLGRKPDPSGLSEFRSRMVDDNWSEKQVREALKASDEYKKTHVDRAIDAAYQDVLGRKPDAAGRKLYAGKMTNEGWDENKVRAALKDSEEYRKKHN